MFMMILLNIIMKKAFGLSGIFGGGLYWNHLISKPKNEKFNIVFDLDHTLIKSKMVSDLKELNLKRQPNFTILNGEYATWTRPYVGIVKCISKVANVHIFTASTQDYADEILNNIYDDIFDKKLYRDDCEEDGKDLRKISDDMSRVVLVDDKLYNNYDGQTFYHIPQFQTHDMFDIELMKVFVYVVSLYVMDDVRKCKGWTIMKMLKN
jgi:hypothetical protein